MLDRSTLLALSALTSLATAHFNLDYPAARGFDEDKLGTFPCGGQDTVSSTRTPFPLSNGQIALTMGHIDANVEVLIAVGNDPGSAFNTVLRPTFKEQGLGAFCMTGIEIPSSLQITEGMNATIQVVTNGDPDGGLYNCADVTFSSTAAAAGTDVCKNGTGVTTGAATVTGNPNVTSSESSSSNSTSGKSAASPGGVGNAWVGGLIVAGAAAWAVVL
ncbi:expression library immunization antigen 1 [Cadophora sp. MPI-SDFR-AT-0126]|nr:expression library immunization antigen 1 [Leotiomycetes sp. MPI-SDFR-AT-0126]